MVQEERKNNFGMVRLICAVMVIAGHMYGLTGQGAPMILWGPIHGFGVAGFFVIGGYLITKSWIRRPVFREYIVKRVFRIFPPLIVCVLLTVFVIGPLMTSLSAKEYFCNPLTWKYMLNCVLYINHLLPGVFENNIASSAVNGSLWCLPVEFLTYLVIPVYIGIGTRLSEKWRKWYYGGCTLFIITARVVWDTWLHGGNGIFGETNYYVQVIIDSFSAVLRIVPYFFVGSLLASCRLEKYLNAQAAIVVIFISSILAYLSGPLYYVGEYLFIPYVILSFALADSPIFAGINKRDISYGMFLSGHVIQQILIHIVVKKGYAVNVWLLMLLSIGFSVAMGFLVERFIEKPAGKLMNRIICKQVKGGC